MTETQAIGVATGLVVAWFSLIPAFWLLASAMRARRRLSRMRRAWEESYQRWEAEVRGAFDS